MNGYIVLTTATVLGSSLLFGCARSTVISPPTPVVSISPSPSPAIRAADVRESDRYRALGLRYRKNGDFRESIEALEKSVKLNPKNLSGRVILGWTQHLAKQSDAARATLEETVGIAPDHVPALNALGIVYLVAGDLPKAIATHEKAAKLKPDNEIAYYNLSLAYHRTGEFDRAIVNGKKAADLEPSNPHPLVALAMVYRDKGDRATATETYRRAIRLDNRYRQRWFLAHLSEAGFSAEQIQKVEELRGG
jgi:tetratricopeptide (TPR) repeat protein